MTPEERKAARRESARAYYRRNKLEIAEKAKAKRAADPEAAKAKARRENESRLARLGREEYLHQARKASRKSYANNKDRVKVRARAYRKTNAEAIGLAARRYREANQQHISEKRKEWRNSFTEQDLAWEARRVAKRANATNSKTLLVGTRGFAPWTPQEETTLIRLIAEHWTHEQVALALGRSRASVVQRWHRIRHQKIDPQQLATRRNSK